MILDPLMNQLAIPPPGECLAGAKGSPITQAETEATELVFAIKAAFGSDLRRITAGAIADGNEGQPSFASVATIGEGLATHETIRFARVVNGSDSTLFRPVVVNGTAHPIAVTLEHRKIEG
jgi:hypothetical protein